MDLFGNTKKKNEYCDMAIRKIEELLSRNSIYDICQFVIIKSKDGNSKITINIICNGFYFEFADIIIKMAVFKSVSKHYSQFSVRRKSNLFQSTLSLLQFQSFLILKLFSVRQAFAHGQSNREYHQEPFFHQHG